VVRFEPCLARKAAEVLEAEARVVLCRCPWLKRRWSGVACSVALLRVVSLRGARERHQRAGAPTSART